MTARMGVWVAAVAALVGGCNSASESNVLDIDCHVSWLDDGVTMKATTGNAVWASKGGMDSVDLQGVNNRAGVEIYTAAPTPLTAQTFVCGQTAAGQSVVLTYRIGSPPGPAISSESCTVAFTQLGAVGTHIAGTFDVVFDLPGGGTKTVTNGSFEIPLSL